MDFFGGRCTWLMHAIFKFNRRQRFIDFLNKSSNDNTIIISLRERVHGYMHAISNFSRRQRFIDFVISSNDTL